MLWVLQHVVDSQIVSGFGRWDVHLIGISLAMLCFFVVPYAPSLVANSIWGAALLSQIVLPVRRAWINISDEKNGT